MSLRNRSLLALALSVAILPLAEAGVSTPKALKACKTEAQARFAPGGQQARVKLKGIVGAGARQKLRLEVIPPTGERFLVLCELNRAGEVLAIDPVDKAMAVVARTAR